MLKKLALLLLALFVFQTSYAGHEEGGLIINYRSLAHVNGDSLEYEVTLYSIYSLAGISAPLSFNVNLSSSCYPNSSFSLPRVSNSTGGLLPLNGNDYCAPTVNINANFGLGMYRDTVILPGKCSDFRFHISSGFGRYSTTQNMSSSFSTNYFFVTLNNTNGPNSCPQVDPLDVIQAACLLKPLTLYGFEESDGDSIVYTPSTPQYITGPTISNLSYNPGYSRNNPVGSSSGYSMDTATGVVQTTLSSIGSYAIGIKFVEYRYDTALGGPLQIAKGRFIMNLIAASSCTTSPFHVQHKNGLTSDSIQCGESTAIIEGTRKMEGLSISPNGSEFIVQSKRSPGLDIISASLSGDSLINLTFNQKVNSSDTILILIDDGTDTNTIYSICGRELPAFADTLRFYTPALPAINPQFSTTSNLLNISFNSGSTPTTSDSLAWNFGDGSPVLSNINNPMHLYSMPGVYTVVLKAFNACGDADSISQTITVCDSIAADFSYSVSGDTLFFDATSAIGVDVYDWNFGDGNTQSGMGASAQTGFHVYASPGNYTVTLIATNPCGDTSIFSILVENCALPTVWWTYNIITSNQNGMQVAFNGNASTNASRYIWDFGDGTVDSSSLSPTHTYATPSLSYLVNLDVYNDCADKVSLSYRLDQIGLDEQTLVPDFDVYPNPTTDMITVSWDDKDSKELLIRIVNLNGQLLMEKRPSKEEILNQRIKIDLSELPAAMYQLELIGESFKSNQRIILSPQAR